MSARRTAATGALALAWLVAPTAAHAAESEIDIVDTETVQVYLDSSGEVDAQRVYEQLVLRGDGEVEVSNPVATEGLRNLDGFGSAKVRDGAQVATYDVDGVLRTRTVSDHEGELPLAVSVRYLLDGEEVEPGDVIGADGLLEVAYTVRNTTQRSQEVTIPDGRGGTTTREVDVAVPFAGSLTTTLPENFTAVEAPKGVRAGDGRGGTKVSFTLTLFPPIGAPEATVGWSARVRDGVVPRAELTALPVDPLANPSFGTAVKGYEGGRDKGIELADGAGEMDANLLRLRDGAQELLGGLLQLHEGADTLRAGLQEKAVPGARKLSAGAAELDAGLARLEDGAGRVAGGNADAAAGSRDLHEGLTRISAGLGLLAAVDGLPAAEDAAGRLKAGVDQLLAGVGAVGTAGTLLDGLARLEAGLGQLAAGLGQVAPGVTAAKGGVDQVTAGLAAALASGGSLDQLAAGLAALKGLDCGPVCAGVIDSKLLPGVQQSRTQLTGARDGLLQVSAGLGQAATALTTQLLPGVQSAAAGATAAKNGAGEVKVGLGKVRAGLAELEAGLADAVAGVLVLDAGSGDAADGAGELASGLGLLEDGSAEVADGLDRAHDGSSQVAAGNGELAGKLVEAADGSSKIADGLGEAAGGAPRLVDGAGRLSTEGAQVIGEKGAGTAQDYGELLAVMEAGSERAADEAMAYGAPEGATGLTAYNFVLQGDDGATQRNVTRGLVGAALLGLGGGVFLLRRRYWRY